MRKALGKSNIYEAVDVKEKEPSHNQVENPSKICKQPSLILYDRASLSPYYQYHQMG